MRFPTKRCNHKIKQHIYSLCPACEQEAVEEAEGLRKKKERPAESSQPGDPEQAPYNPTVNGADHYGGFEIGQWRHRRLLRSHQTDQSAEIVELSQAAVLSEPERSNHPELRQSTDEIRPESPTLPPSELARFSIRRTVVNAPHGPDDIYVSPVQLQQPPRPEVRRQLTARQQRAFDKETSVEFLREEALDSGVGEYYNYLYPEEEEIEIPEELQEAMNRGYSTQSEEDNAIDEVMNRLLTERARQNAIPRVEEVALNQEYASAEEQPNAVEEVMNRLMAEHAGQNAPEELQEAMNQVYSSYDEQLNAIDEVIDRLTTENARENAARRIEAPAPQLPELHLAVSEDPETVEWNVWTPVPRHEPIEQETRGRANAELYRFLQVPERSTSPSAKMLMSTSWFTPTLQNQNGEGFLFEGPQTLRHHSPSLERVRTESVSPLARELRSLSMFLPILENADFRRAENKDPFQDRKTESERSSSLSETASISTESLSNHRDEALQCLTRQIQAPAPRSPSPIVQEELSPENRQAHRDLALFYLNGGLDAPLLVSPSLTIEEFPSSGKQEEADRGNRTQTEDPQTPQQQLPALTGMESISPLDLNGRGDRGSAEDAPGNDSRPESLLDGIVSDSMNYWRKW